MTKKPLSNNQKVVSAVGVGVARVFVITFAVMILLGNVHAEFSSIPALGYWTVFSITFFYWWTLLLVVLGIKLKFLRIEKKFAEGVYV